MTAVYGLIVFLNNFIVITLLGYLHKINKKELIWILKLEIRLLFLMMLSEEK